jgi:hypothetical protein
MHNLIKPELHLYVFNRKYFIYTYVQLSQCNFEQTTLKKQCRGCNVMITIFGGFDQFSTKNCVFFQTNVIIYIFWMNSCILSSNLHFFKFCWRKKYTITLAAWKKRERKPQKVNCFFSAISEQSGNYTCGPSNTKPASIRLHIVDSEFVKQLDSSAEVHS